MGVPPSGPREWLGRGGARSVAVPLAVAALAAVWALCPAFAEQVPRDTLTWGFCQVGGTGRGAE
jgi:hypothetical protein